MAPRRARAESWSRGGRAKAQARRRQAARMTSQIFSRRRRTASIGSSLAQSLSLPPHLPPLQSMAPPLLAGGGGVVRHFLLLPRGREELAAGFGQGAGGTADADRVGELAAVEETQIGQGPP